MSVVSDAPRGLADVYDQYWDPVGCYHSVHPQKATWTLTVTLARKHDSILMGETLKVFCSNYPSPQQRKNKQSK